MMPNRSFFLFIALLLSVIPCHADTIDSLYRELKNANRPNIKTANSLMIALDAEGTADSLYTFTSDDRAADIMKTLSLYMAYHYDAHYQYMLAVDAFRQMAAYAHEGGDQAAEGDALSQAAVEYHRIGNLEKAIEASMQALHIDSLLCDTALLSNDFSTLAGTCLAAGRHDDAVVMIERAIAIEQSRAVPEKLAIRYGIASEIYNKKGDADRALHYAEMAYELDRKAGNAVGTARRLSQMADIYQARGELSQAENFYRRAISILEENGELHSLTIDYRQLGTVYFMQGIYRLSEQYLLKADSLAQRTGNKYLLSLTEKALADNYQAWGHYDKACPRLQKAMELRDSINTERLQQMAANFIGHDEIDQQHAELMSQRDTIRLLQTGIAVLALLLVVSIVFLFILRRKVEELDKLNTKQPVEELDKLNSLQPVVELEKISSLTQMADDDRQFLLKVVDFVNVNMKARKITVDLLAQEMCMSRSQLARRLTALTGESPNIFITNVRMERARRLLKSTNMSVNEIAYECGYDEASYFIRVFRQELGMTPQQYRNMPIAG